MFYRRDPVCRARVSVRTGHTFQYNRRTYYFDSAACLATFKNEPHCFIKKKKGGFWAWLGKNSKDVPKSCHEMKE